METVSRLVATQSRRSDTAESDETKRTWQGGAEPSFLGLFLGRRVSFRWVWRGDCGIVSLHLEKLTAEWVRECRGAPAREPKAGGGMCARSLDLGSGCPQNKFLRRPSLAFLAGMGRSKANYRLLVWDWANGEVSGYLLVHCPAAVRDGLWIPPFSFHGLALRTGPARLMEGRTGTSHTCCSQLLVVTLVCRAPHARAM